MAAERGNFIEKTTKLSKKIDYYTIGAGTVISVFNPGVGWALIIGSVLTFIPANEIERWQKRRRRK